MCSIEIHKFFLSYKINGEIHTGWFAGMNLRYAKEKLLFQYSEATDIMDWTYEKGEDLKKYLAKHRIENELAEKHLQSHESER